MKNLAASHEVSNPNPFNSLVASGEELVLERLNAKNPASEASVPFESSNPHVTPYAVMSTSNIPSPTLIKNPPPQQETEPNQIQARNENGQIAAKQMALNPAISRNPQKVLPVTNIAVNSKTSMQLPAKPLPVNHSVVATYAKLTAVQRTASSPAGIQMVDPLLKATLAD